MDAIDKEFALLREYMDYFIEKLENKYYLSFAVLDLEYENQFNAFKTKDKRTYKFIGKHFVCKSISHDCIIFTFEEYKAKYENGKYKITY